MDAISQRLTRKIWMLYLRDFHTVGDIARTVGVDRNTVRQKIEQVGLTYRTHTQQRVLGIQNELDHDELFFTIASKYNYRPVALDCFIGHNNLQYTRKNTATKSPKHLERVFEYVDGRAHELIIGSMLTADSQEEVCDKHNITRTTFYQIRRGYSLEGFVQFGPWRRK